MNSPIVHGQTSASNGLAMTKGYDPDKLFSKSSASVRAQLLTIAAKVNWGARHSPASFHDGRYRIPTPLRQEQGKRA